MPSSDTVTEIIRLQRHVHELETELSRIATEPPEGTDDLAQGQEKFEFEFTYATVSDFQTQQGETSMTWDDLFAVLSPLMIDEANEKKLRFRLNGYLKEWAVGELLDFQSGLSVRETDFHTIKIQLRALGLIEQSVKAKRSLRDTATYWTLSPFGNNYMTKLLAIRKGDTPTK